MAKHKGGKGNFAGTKPSEDKQPKENPMGDKFNITGRLPGKGWDGTGRVPDIKYPTNVYPTEVYDNHKDGD
jgi:hypothetical protein